MLVGVVLVGGITAGAMLADDEPEQPALSASLPASSLPTSSLPTSSRDGEAAPSADLLPEERGQIAVDLPGGFGFKVPSGAVGLDGSDLEIDGVGLYPGAKAQDMQVRVLQDRASDGSRALITMAFSSPDSPDKVADWYMKSFEEADVTVTRTQNQLSGTSQDGNRFTITIEPIGKASRGVVRVRAARGGEG